MKVAQLYAPPYFVAASAEVRAVVTNGCGPSGWKVGIITDSIWGVDIRPACDIHDWMYAEGETPAAKDEADRVFLNNMLRLIDAAGGCRLLQWLRRIDARTYYEAVQHFGGPAFWAGKNPAANIIEVPCA
jgi:hypothetical protein